MEWRFAYEVARVLSKMREGGEEGYYAKKSWRRTMEGGTSMPSERNLNSSVISDTTSILSAMPWLLPITVRRDVAQAMLLAHRASGLHSGATPDNHGGLGVVGVLWAP